MTGMIVSAFIFFFFCLLLEFIWPYSNAYNMNQHLFIEHDEIKPDRDA